MARSHDLTRHDRRSIRTNHRFSILRSINAVPDVAVCGPHASSSAWVINDADKNKGGPTIKIRSERGEPWSVAAPSKKKNVVDFAPEGSEIHSSSCAYKVHLVRIKTCAGFRISGGPARRSPGDGLSEAFPRGAFHRPTVHYNFVSKHTPLTFQRFNGFPALAQSVFRTGQCAHLLGCRVGLCVKNEKGHRDPDGYCCPYNDRESCGSECASVFVPRVEALYRHRGLCCSGWRAHDHL